MPPNLKVKLISLPFSYGLNKEKIPPLITFAENCLPEEVPLEKTVGYVIHDSVMHGKCVNVEPVHGLTECVGHCQSKTIHEPSKNLIIKSNHWN